MSTPTKFQSNHRHDAKRALNYYFKLVALRNGLFWTSDNEAEVEGIVDSIVDAAVAEAKAAR